MFTKNLYREILNTTQNIGSVVEKYHAFSVSVKKFEKILNKDKKDYMEKKNLYDERWADEKTAAEYLKVKPATLRRRRSLLGKDTNEVWHKNHGKILYDLWKTDKRIEQK